MGLQQLKTVLWTGKELGYYETAIALHNVW